MLTIAHKHIASAFQELLNEEQFEKINNQARTVEIQAHVALEKTRELLANTTEENVIAYAQAKQALEIATTRLESTVQIVMNELVKREPLNDGFGS